MNQEMREKQVLERILSLKQMIQDGRSGPIELHELGVCYYLIENFRTAAGFLADLVKQYPDYVEIAAVQSLRIFCLVQDGELLEAEILLKERMQMDPTNATLLGMLAHVQEKTARTEDAIQTHRRILDIDPGNNNSRNSLGYLLAVQGKKEQFGEALEHLKQAVTSKPDHPAYLDSLGMLLLKSGDRERARKAFLKALSRSPENTVILDHLKDLM
ncbi:MAG: tetratricopeptide repeat protein [Spirochaetia bacterium]|nr:tetratricopeptide repeat protein [Spirochaetia bacterium]